jgi:hypothetical protein
MRKTFNETGEFNDWVREYLSDESLSELQKVLLNDLDTEVVMPGCGGLRKMLVASPKRGKGNGVGQW